LKIGKLPLNAGNAKGCTSIGYLLVLFSQIRFTSEKGHFKKSGILSCFSITPLPF